MGREHVLDIEDGGVIMGAVTKPENACASHHPKKELKQIRAGSVERAPGEWRVA